MWCRELVPQDNQGRKDSLTVATSTALPDPVLCPLLRDIHPMASIPRGLWVHGQPALPKYPGSSLELPAQKHWARMLTATTRQGEWTLCELSFTQKCLLLHPWSLPTEASSSILYLISPCHFGSLAPASYPLSFQQCKSLPLLCFQLSLALFIPPHMLTHSSCGSD